MKGFIFGMLLFSLSGHSMVVQAAKYDSMTRAEFLSLGKYQKGRYVYGGKENEKDVYICADWARGIPGKLIDGWCYVGWNGKEYRNDSYQALVSEGEIFVSAIEHITRKKRSLITRNAIHTNSGLFHCSVFEGGSRNYTFGYFDYQYEECLISWKGSQYAHSASGPFPVQILAENPRGLLFPY